MNIKKHIGLIALYVSLFFFVTSCGNTSQPQDDPDSPRGSLTAVAGNDQSVLVGQNVLLSGAGSSEGANVSYSWTLASRPANSKVSFTQANKLQHSFNPDVVGPYTIRLTVSDGNAQATDDVLITAGQRPTSGRLEPGETVEEGGVVLGAPQGALAESVNVGIRRVGLPTKALPAGVETVADVYALSAERQTMTPPGKPLLLGLSVPDGIRAEKLAIAVLVPRPYLLFTPTGDGKRVELTDTWFYSSASFNEERRVLTAKLYLLPTDELQVVIVQSDSFRTLLPNKPGLSTQATEDFSVDCDPAFENVNINCTSSDRTAAEEAFETVYEDLTNLGFTEYPRLDREGWCDVVSLLCDPNEAPYYATLVPMDGTIAGLYNWATAVITIGLDSFGFSDSSSGPDDIVERLVVRHEYFHATQFGYAGLGFVGFTNPLNAGWSIESQAVISERSVPVVTRSPSWDLRDPELSLLHYSYSFDDARAEYKAQDFWYYLMKREGADLDFLIPFLENGHIPERVDEVFAGGHGGFSSLGDAYWGWVKTQVFREELSIDNNSTTPCDTVAQLINAASLKLDYDPVNGLSEAAAFDLEPLDSKLIKISPEHADSLNYLSYDAHFDIQSSSNDLKFKFYKGFSQTDCDTQGEGPRTVNVARTNSTMTLYALISNTNYSNSTSAQLVVSSDINQVTDVKIDFVKPSGNTFREGNYVSFEVDIESPNATAELKWFIDNELTRTDDIPQGNSTATLGFYPCSPTTTVTATLRDTYDKEASDSHFVDVIPNLMQAQLVEGGIFQFITTDEQNFISNANYMAAVYKPTCNDPDSKKYPIATAVKWLNEAGNIFAVGHTLKLSQKDFVDKSDRLQQRNLTLVYDDGKEKASSKVRLYPCAPVSVLVKGGAYLPCISYQDSRVLENMFTKLESFETKREATDFATGLWETGLGKVGLSPKAIPAQRDKLLADVAQAYGKSVVSYAEQLLRITDTTTVGRFEVPMKSLLQALAKGGWSDKDAQLILNLTSLVLTEVNAFAPVSEGGEEQWLNLLFADDPNTLAGRVNVISPAQAALETYLSVLVSTSKATPEQALELAHYAAVLAALEQVKER